MPPLRAALLAALLCLFIRPGRTSVLDRRAVSLVRVDADSSPSPAPELCEAFLSEGLPCKRNGPYDYPKCAPGLWCEGFSSPKCVQRSRVGGECGTEYAVCSVGSECVTGTCISIEGMDENYLAEGAVCGRSVKNTCFPGLWCVAGRCLRLIPAGGTCGTSGRHCRSELVCAPAPSGKKVCQCVPGRMLEVRQKGEVCEPDGPPCRTGLVCVKRVGASCPQGGDEGRRCIDALPGICRVPARLGRPCGAEFSDCESGNKCYVVNDVGIHDVGECMRLD